VPFKSIAQQHFAYAHPEKFGGQEGLKEWSSDTDFSSLPERKKKKKKRQSVSSTELERIASMKRD
jgi:hypothetical protein